MDEPKTSRPLPPAAAQLQTLVDLRDRLVELHAELEFMRLMLKMREPGLPGLPSKP